MSPASIICSDEYAGPFRVLHVMLFVLFASLLGHHRQITPLHAFGGSQVPSISLSSFFLLLVQPKTSKVAPSPTLFATSEK